MLGRSMIQPHKIAIWDGLKGVFLGVVEVCKRGVRLHTFFWRLFRDPADPFSGFLLVFWWYILMITFRISTRLALSNKIYLKKTPRLKNRGLPKVQGQSSRCKQRLKQCARNWCVLGIPVSPTMGFAVIVALKAVGFSFRCFLMQFRKSEMILTTQNKNKMFQFQQVSANALCHQENHHHHHHHHHHHY